jgi:probable rRNA maturation factor
MSLMTNPSEDVPEPDSPASASFQPDPVVAETLADWVFPDFLIDHQLAVPGWRGHLDAGLEQSARRLIAGVKAAHPLPPARLSILWTDDDEMMQLNRDWRGKDGPTNILSFDNGTDDPQTGCLLLGDLALGLDVIEAEAARAGIAVADHLAHLLLHGVLHLCGFDHATEAEAARMEALESQLMTAAGLDDPWAEGGAA